MKLDTYKTKSFKLSRYKYIEFQLSRWSDSKLFGLQTWVRRKTDHPGIAIFITLFYYELSIDFYDSRHWKEICVSKKD
jgi:hypothetical protein